MTNFPNSIRESVGESYVFDPYRILFSFPIY